MNVYWIKLTQNGTDHDEWSLLLYCTLHVWVYVWPFPCAVSVSAGIFLWEGKLTAPAGSVGFYTFIKITTSGKSYENFLSGWPPHQRLSQAILMPMTSQIKQYKHTSQQQTWSGPPSTDGASSKLACVSSCPKIQSKSLERWQLSGEKVSAFKKAISQNVVVAQ